MTVIVDTGPLVALLDARDQWHLWAKATLAEERPPLVTCEAVLAEVCWILRGTTGGASAVLAMCERGVLRADFRLADEALAVRKLIDRYGRVPMSLADACLVRMSELLPKGELVTLDSDFRVYRRNGRSLIPMRAPWTS